MKRVRTTNEPSKIIEVEDGELLELERLGILAEVLDQDKTKKGTGADDSNESAKSKPNRSGGNA